jgi:hypothetical protein
VAICYRPEERIDFPEEAEGTGLDNDEKKRWWYSGTWRGRKESDGGGLEGIQAKGKGQRWASTTERSGQGNSKLSSAALAQSRTEITESFRTDFTSAQTTESLRVVFFLLYCCCTVLYSNTNAR